MRKIQKAKLVNGCLEVEYTETQHESGNKVSDTIKLSGGHKVHADLLATFDIPCLSNVERQSMSAGKRDSKFETKGE